LLALALVGCSQAPAEEPADPPADQALALVARALTDLDFTAATFADGVRPAAEIDQLIEAMDGFRPQVSPGAIDYQGSGRASGRLDFVWGLPSGDWAYQSTVRLNLVGEDWTPEWAPDVIHPRLDAQTRLIRLRSAAKRAGITGQGGQNLVQEIAITRLGIDKTFIAADQWEASARALAQLLDLDLEAYAQQVLEAGPQAFVEAERRRPDQVPDILSVPGARGLADSVLTTATPGFMAEILGTLREATAEEVEASQGRIVAGELVGAAGLQRVFDASLRGVPGDQVYLGPRGDDFGQASADNILHDVPAVPGETLATSFDTAAQQQAEAVLAQAGQPAAAAIVRPSDGAILAAAVSPQTEGRPDATLNHFPPGSTFKIVTALALLRHGLTPDSPVDCPTAAVAGGVVVRNYDGYPAAFNGTISLAQAMAQSCNTAFVSQAGRLDDGDLLAAAGSLGAGIDYDAGGLLYGVVPVPDSAAMLGQMTIGQGGVLMSPVAMAGVIASVAAGHTVVPWMAAPLKPVSTAAPLTAAEAAALQLMLSYTVSDGLASNLQGVAVGAKSGTAEYGSGDPLPTHAWMVAYNGADLAAAVWAQDGGGSSTAGPLIQQLLA
jgi:cell division protein FtsI/penicillin-binding protein 2